MDLMVLPQIENEHERTRTQDELPQSSGGRTITTTEPKFIPKEAAQIEISDGINVKVRLIDCVGYMVEGAAGHMEEDVERMVKTPWFQRGNPIHTGGGDWHQKGDTGSLHHWNCRYDGRQLWRDTAQLVQSGRGADNHRVKELGKPFVVLVNTTKAIR